MTKLMIEEAEWDGELEVLGAEGAVRLKVVSAELVELVELDDRYKEEYGDLSIQLDLIMPPARERSSRTVSTPSTSSAPGTPPSPSSPLWRVSPCRTSCCGPRPGPACWRGRRRPRRRWPGSEPSNGSASCRRAWWLGLPTRNKMCVFIYVHNMRKQAGAGQGGRGEGALLAAGAHGQAGGGLQPVGDTSPQHILEVSSENVFPDHFQLITQPDL